MNHTRRDAIALMGAMATATAAINGAKAATPSNKMTFWAACTTPCDKNLKVDLGAMREQIEWYKAHGADGVTFLGSTGEFASFTVAERKAIMETVGKAKGNLNVLCTSGTANVADRQITVVPSADKPIAQRARRKRKTPTAIRSNPSPRPTGRCAA